MQGKGVILVDLDGTLAHYDGWKGEEHIGDPIPEMVNKIKQDHSEGYRLKIFTARVCNHVHWVSLIDNKDLKRNYSIVLEWLKKHNIIQFLDKNEPIAITKNWEVVEIWDDRAKQIELNTGRFI
jgi:hypothetical protein